MFLEQALFLCDVERRHDATRGCIADGDLFVFCLASRGCYGRGRPDHGEDDRPYGVAFEASSEHCFSYRLVELPWKKLRARSRDFKPNQLWSPTSKRSDGSRRTLHVTWWSTRRTDLHLQAVRILHKDGCKLA